MSTWNYGFWMGKHEVTQGQWKTIMGNNPSAFKTGDNHPAMVSWDKTQEFIRELKKRTGGDYRLPTEAEWEYVCRHLGKGLLSGTLMSENKKSENPLDTDESELYGMNNKTDEWCQDIYSADAYAKHPVSNPLYEGHGGGRVVRRNPPCTYRFGSQPDIRTNDIGFRLVRLE